MNHWKVAHGNMSGGLNLLDHDKRREAPERNRKNENIDPSLSHLNKDLSARKMTPSEAWERANALAQVGSKKKLRDNQIVMSCDVITLPGNWDECSHGADPMIFFRDFALPFLRNRYGILDSETGECINEISAVVHFDEIGRYDKRDGYLIKGGRNVHTHEEVPDEFVMIRHHRPHMHRKDVPLQIDETGELKLNHKRVHSRTDLSTLHKDLQRAADEWCEKKGYEKGLDLYDPDRAEKSNQVTIEEYKRQQEKKEELENEIEHVRAELDGTRAELAEVREGLERAKADAMEWRRRASEAEFKVAGFESDMRSLTRRLDSLMERVAGIFDAMTVVREGKHVFQSLSDWMGRFFNNVHVKAAYEAVRGRRGRMRDKAYVRTAESAILRSVADEASAVQPELASLSEQARAMRDSYEQIERESGRRDAESREKRGSVGGDNR